jgi:NAD(P)-dependent dehydrogenase (short-subunit alcohol dehydrogenase family)
MLAGLALLAPPIGAATAVGVGIGSVALLRWLRAADLRGAVVLITGGSRGLGYALAEEFARHGARLAICARGDEGLTLAASRLREQGAEVVPIRCDVGDRAQVNRTVAWVEERLGPVDVLVNNAGIMTVGPLEAQTAADFDEAMRVMYWGVVNTTLAVLPGMRERRAGRIVNITSIGGKVSVPHLLPYGSAKFAAVGFSEGLHAEVAKDGISVTTVVPGLMRTGSYVNAFFKGRNQAEYTWFSLSDSVPPAAISVRRAARQIVWAARTGRAELVISLPAQVLARIHGLLPGITTRLLGLANRLLPQPGGIGTQRAIGRQSETPLTQSFVTGLSQRAMERYNQLLQQGQATPDEVATL